MVPVKGERGIMVSLAILLAARSHRETEPQTVLLHGKAKVTKVRKGIQQNLAEGSRSRTYPSLSDRPCRF